MKKSLFHISFGMTFLFAFVVYVSLVAFFWLTGAVTYFLVQVGILNLDVSVLPHLGPLVYMVSVVSIPVGAVVASVVSAVPLRPIRELITSMDKLASGDFKTRVNVGRVMRRYPPFVQLCNSFNKMAEQLENTEMLRTDFINNFSHEFKTPIVSIAGFTKLLKRDNLDLQQRREYLDVIEEEARRLSYMATNVLNLSKVENQAILTDVSTFNLSEQIRSCILLLENKWEQKELEFQLDFDEHTVSGNEELLKEVWINLLDNAIKFTPDANTVQIRIEELAGALRVAVRNTGVEISPEQQKKIFNKFYQADESHSTQGNGVGLAIVKQVVKLHGGAVGVTSGDQCTEFTVTIPKEGPS